MLEESYKENKERTITVVITKNSQDNIKPQCIQTAITNLK